jgi:hypothetical protein
MIAVFKFDGLADLPWFKETVPEPPSQQPLAATVSTADELRRESRSAAAALTGQTEVTRPSAPAGQRAQLRTGTSGAQQKAQANHAVMEPNSEEPLETVNNNTREELSPKESSVLYTAKNGAAVAEEPQRHNASLRDRGKDPSSQPSAPSPPPPPPPSTARLAAARSAAVAPSVTTVPPPLPPSEGREADASLSSNATNNVRPKRGRKPKASTVAKAPEELEANPAAKLAKKRASTAAEEPAEKPVENPTEKPAKRPAEELVVKSADRSAKRRASSAVEQLADKPAKKQVSKAAEKPADKPAQKQPSKTAGKEVDKPDNATSDNSPENRGEMSELIPAEVAVEPSVEQSAQQSSKKTTRSLKFTERGTVNYKRKQIILELVDKVGGVFPGDRELWYAFSVIWMSRNPESGRPDVRTLFGIQKSLIDSGQLLSFKFSFSTLRGLRCEKRILARTHLTADSPVVKELEAKMKAAGTSYYIPPEADIPEEARKRYEQGNTHKSATLPRAAVAEEPTARVKLVQRDPQLQSDSTPYPFQSEQRRLRKVEKRLENARLREDRKKQRLELGREKRSRDAVDGNAQMSSGEQQEAARKIRRIARSKPSSRLAHRNGPARVARLHGIGGLAEPAPSDARAQPASTRGRTRPYLLYKRQRLQLNSCLQIFHAASGTFGTLFSIDTHTQRKLNSKKAADAANPLSLGDIISRSRKRKGIDHSQTSDPAWSRFEREIDTVRDWELRKFVPKDGRAMPWTFINHHVEDAQMPTPTVPTVRISNGDSTGFAAQAMPGASLPNTAPAQRRRRAKRAADAPAAGARPAKRVRIATTMGEASGRMAGRAQRAEPVQRPRPRYGRASSKFKTRSLTAAPVVVGPDSEFQDASQPQALTVRGRQKAKGKRNWDDGPVFPFKHSRSLIHIISGPTGIRRFRMRTTGMVMTEADVQRLVVGVTVVRTLTGGIDRNIDWVIVATLFPHLDQSFINKKWGPIAAKFRLQMDRLQSDFQEAFLSAYQAGVVPQIDYDNLLNYNWNALVDWAQTNLDVPV